MDRENSRGLDRTEINTQINFVFVFKENIITFLSIFNENLKGIFYPFFFNFLLSYLLISFFNPLMLGLHKKRRNNRTGNDIISTEENQL